MLPLDFQATNTLKLSKDDTSVEFQRWISYSKYESSPIFIDVIHRKRLYGNRCKMKLIQYSMQALSNN